MSELTINEKDFQRIATLVNSQPLAKGVGSHESACSIASINLALTGRLTDQIPDCMSPLVGYWIVRVQDRMPDALRNAPEWRNLLPYAAGTGREKEQERAEKIINWFWENMPIGEEAAKSVGMGTFWKKAQESRGLDHMKALHVQARRRYSEIFRKVTEQKISEASTDFGPTAEMQILDYIVRIDASLRLALSFKKGSGKYQSSEIGNAACCLVAMADVHGIGKRQEEGANVSVAWEKLNPAGLLSELVK